MGVVFLAEVAEVAEVIFIQILSYARVTPLG